MANKTYAVHTSEELIRRVDQHAVRLRRSRNSFLNEAIEIGLELYDRDLLEEIERKNKAKKKAGTH
jgi:predicted DNA-binding protein